MYPKLKKKKSNASKTETKKQSNMKSHVRTNKAGGLVLLLKKKVLALIWAIIQW